MNSIEINSSFYKVPIGSTVLKWANDVPEEFKFTFKLSKAITHNKVLAFDPGAVKHFMQVISLVGDKRGCLLVQFPPSVRIWNLNQLALLMACLRDCDPDGNWKITLEFRHVSLYTDQVYRLLEDYGLGMVIQDKPPANTPMLDTDLDFVYLRFHGPGGSYRGSYEDDLLYEYAGYIRDWMAEGKTVYTYFNNTVGEAIPNLFSLRDLVMETGLEDSCANLIVFTRKSAGKLIVSAENLTGCWGDQQFDKSSCHKISFPILTAKSPKLVRLVFDNMTILRS